MRYCLWARASFLSTCVFLSSSFFVDSLAFASEEQLQKDFAKLKHVPVNYEVFGTVCEQVAKLRLSEYYPENTHKIYVGIEYFDRHRQLGELDVVVLRKKDAEAIIVAEVKCWKNFQRALKKAYKQLNRFQRTIEQEIPLHMQWSRDRDTEFMEDQFDESPDLVTISQNGGEEAGFDMEIGLTTAEVYRLHDMLLEYHGKPPVSHLFHTLYNY